MLLLTDKRQTDTDVVWMLSLLCWWTNIVSSCISLYVGSLTCYPLSQFSGTKHSTHIITPSSSHLFLISSSLSLLSLSSS